MRTTSRLSILTTVLLTSLTFGSTQAATLVHYGFETVEEGSSPATTVAVGASATAAANNNAGNPLGSSPLGFFSASTINGNHVDGTGIVVGTGGTSGAGTAEGSVLNFRANGGQTLAEATATVEGIPTSGEYFSFTLSGLGGNTLTPTTLSFDLAKGGTGNDRGVVVWYSTDAFASDATVLGNGSENTAVLLAGNNDLLARNVSFSLASLTDPVSSIEFRFFSTNNSGNTIKLDNIIVEGAVIPEPAYFGLLAAGAAGFLVWRRRRQRKTMG